MINHRRYGQKLTDIEHRVLRDMANGHSNNEIAAQMSRTSATVKTHVKTVLAKLGARNRAHAVRLGYEAGLLGTADVTATVGTP